MIIYQQNIAMATTEAINNGPKEQAFFAEEASKQILTWK